MIGRVGTIAVILLALAGCAHSYSVDLAPEVSRITVDGEPLPAGHTVDLRVITASEDGVFLDVGNNANETVHLVWDDASLVGLDGYSTRVVPGESRVLDAARSQPATPIPAHARTRVWAVAAGGSGPAGGKADPEEFAGICRSFLDQEMRLVLPVRIGNGAAREYVLRLRIAGADVRSLRVVERCGSMAEG